MFATARMRRCKNGGSVPTERKIALVAQLKELLEASDIAIAMSYQGMPVTEQTELRRQLRRSHLGTPFVARNAVLDGQVVDGEYVTDLATVPPREELLARIAGGLTAKITELVLLLQASTRELAGLLDARAQQLEEAEA